MKRIDAYFYKGLDGLDRVVRAFGRVGPVVGQAVVYCAAVALLVLVFPFWCLEKLCTIVSRSGKSRP